MSNNNDNPDTGDERHDDDTLELVALDATIAGEEEGGDSPLPQSQAFLWLKHMEAELDELQARWNEIDRELTRRDARIDELTAEMQSGGATAAALREQLAEAASEIEAMREATRTKEAQHEEEASRHRGELEAGNQALESLRAQLKRRDTALADLRGAVADHERANAALAERQAASADRIAALEAASAERIATLEAELARAGEARDAAARERDELAGALGEAERRLTAAEALAEAASEEAHGVQAKLAAERGRVRQLEAELKERSETWQLLDKNLRRINVLGASLQRIERSGTVAEAMPAQTDTSRPVSNVRYIGGVEGGAHARKKALVCLDGPTSATFQLEKHNTTIGRSRESDIRINGQFVSRIHARVLTYAAGTVVEDLGSKNGILVNSRPVTRCALKDGDIVSLGGKLDLRYVELDA